MLPVPVPRRIVSQACDACRRRKIKCNGLQPCPGCQSARLACTFDLPQKRGGRQGARATVLNGLRESQQTEGHPDAYGALSPADCFSALGRGFVDACVDAYFRKIHPVVPFLTEGILQAEVSRRTDSLLSQQFVISFCAYVVAFGNVLGAKSGPSHVPDARVSKQLLDAALRISVPERIAAPSLSSVFTSFFLYGAFAALGNYAQGWFYLREAITLFLLCPRRAEPPTSQSAYARTFWVLLISERSHGIRKSRPITLQVTPESPLLDGPDQLGLRFLANLFRPFDEVFFALWNGSRQDCSRDWLLGLERDVQAALPAVLDLSNEQIANLRVSQLWLQVKLWELFPRFGFLSSESAHECLTFQYPVALARTLAVLAVKLPIASLQIHGVGMTEKIFDIACALADVLPFVSIAASHTELGPVDYLTQITTLLAKLPGSPKFVPLLLAKLNELLPDLVKPLCEALEVPVIDLEPLSPDSRYLYEEEVRTNLYMDLRRSN